MSTAISTSINKMIHNNSKRNPNLSKWNILFEKDGKQWMSVKPQEGNEVYTCYACRELFSSKNSFLDHVNRFTMVLNYKCGPCAFETLQYYNPCALLLHSRRHYNPYGGQLCLDDIQVLCLPYGLIGFPPHPEIPMLYDLEEEDANGANVNTRFYAPVRSNKGKCMITMVPTILLFYHYKLNGTPPVSLVLKQISTNVPKCMFVRLEQNTVATTVTNPVVPEKRSVEQEVSLNRINLSDKNLPNGTVAEDKVNASDKSSNDKANPLHELEIKSEFGTSQNGELRVFLGTDEEVEEISCPECDEIIPEDKNLSSHYVNSNPLSDEFLCEICNYIASSPCSFSAHKRLHFREAPYVCPECGKIFDTNMALLDHMEDVCFHLAKQVRLRCPKKNCCKVFAHLSTFVIHFEVHIQTLNRCTLCDATFYAVRDFVEHGHLVHSSLVPVELIYKCTLCKNAVLQADNYKEHMNMHCVDLNLRVYVYICKLCRNFFRSGATYATHIVRCSQKETTMEELRRLKKCNTSMVCLHCNYVIRLVTKLYDCPRCGKSINSSSNAYDKQGCAVTDTHRKCTMCQEELVKSETHECVYKYPIVILTKEDELINDIIRTKSIPQEVLKKYESSPKRKRRRSPLSTKYKRLATNNVEPRLDEPIPFEGTYTCKVCGYNNNSRKDFHDHIKDHKSISTAYQCMECGECFVVKPSFHKHMMYYHKISNVDEYVKQNECVDESAISELKRHMLIDSGEMINEDVGENQCKVCLKQFEDQLELNKHFRMHGMAFLRDNK